MQNCYPHYRIRGTKVHVAYSRRVWVEYTSREQGRAMLTGAKWTVFRPSLIFCEFFSFGSSDANIGADERSDV